jgi:hypothetical protein
MENGVRAIASRATRTLGVAIGRAEEYEWSMLTEGAKTPPGTQRLVDKSHRFCGAYRWQRPADAATAFTTNT